MDSCGVHMDSSGVHMELHIPYVEVPGKSTGVGAFLWSPYGLGLEQLAEHLLNCPNSDPYGVQWSPVDSYGIPVDSKGIGGGV